MKRISSKLILITIVFISFLMSIVSGMIFQVLLKESRAYTFQNQQLQTEVFASQVEKPFSKVEEIANRIFEIRTSEGALEKEIENLYRSGRNASFVSGIAVFLKEKKKWVEYPALSVSPLANDIVPTQKTAVHSLETENSDQIVMFSSQNAVIAIKMSLAKVKSECAGLMSGFYDDSGQPLFLCNDQITKWVDKNPTVAKAFADSDVPSGSFESTHGETGLWGFASVPKWGKIMSVTPATIAYRPAYLMGLRMGLIVLMAIGISVVGSIIVSRRVTGPISLVTEATQKIANGDLDAKIEVNTRDETRTLADSVQAMAGKLKVLIESEVEKAKLDAQLEVAGAIQRTLIPERDLEVDRFSIHSSYIPADECGGDWWGFVRKGNQLALLIGDVTGHGYPSALLVATTRGYISMLQEQIDVAGNIPFTAIQTLHILNRVVFEATRGELNMTAMCVLIDSNTGEFQLASAAHNPAYQLVKSTGKVNSVNGSGIRLGEAFSVEAPFKEASGKFSPGEKLVLYTDGIWDLGSGEKTLGKKGFKKFLEAHMDDSAKSLIGAMERELIPLNLGAPLMDDVTMVVVEWKS